ncbi:hypothetical protein TNCT_142141 [Trichonephila clavata]|uniref:Uncharacterized protein n=1 Tax=Trichonephila clavata TaxID=2740835 RepID=A0A8X6HA73_TRICU|nr:hypothetical protein TNCT_142141 [Trichonephila clavata]
MNCSRRLQRKTQNLEPTRRKQPSWSGSPRLRQNIRARHLCHPTPTRILAQQNQIPTVIDLCLSCGLNIEVESCYDLKTDHNPLPTLSSTLISKAAIYLIAKPSLIEINLKISHL